MAEGNRYNLRQTRRPRLIYSPSNTNTQEPAESRLLTEERSRPTATTGGSPLEISTDESSQLRRDVRLLEDNQRNSKTPEASGTSAACNDTSDSATPQRRGDEIDISYPSFSHPLADLLDEDPIQHLEESEDEDSASTSDDTTQPTDDTTSIGSSEMANNQDNRLLAAVAMRPTMFNGKKTEKARQWWSAFDRYANFAGIEGENKAQLLGMMLSGIALLWYDALPDDVKEDPEQLEEAFREKYIDAAPDRLQHHIDAMAKSQQDSETVEEYAAEAKTRLHNLGFNAAQQISIIINGLRPDIRSVVLQHLPFETVDALVSKAKNVEQALKNYVKGLPTTEKKEAPKEDGVKEAIQKLTANVTAMQRAMESKDQRGNGNGAPRYQQHRGNPRQDGPSKRCYLCNSPGHLQRDCQQGNLKRCFNCGKPGHLRRECRQNPQGRSNGRQDFRRGPNVPPRFNGGNNYNNWGN